MRSVFSNLIKVLFLSVVFSISAAAAVVQLSDFGTPNDHQNDAAAFQAAFDSLKTSGGGTLIVSPGTWELDGEIDLRSYGDYVSYKIQGDKGAVIQLGGSSPKSIFTVGNVNQFELRDLIFTGRPTGYDVSTLVYVYYTQIVLVSGCQFFGVYSQMPLFEIGNTDAVFENNQFEGSGSAKSLIYGSSSLRSLTVRNNTFIDYANFRNSYYSKGGGPAWICVEADETQTVNANAGATVIIDGGRFDEGALSAISISNARNVEIRNIAVNVSGYEGGNGVTLKNVKYGVVESSVFGYPLNIRPALVLKTGSKVSAARLAFGGGVYFADVDGSSHIQVTNCDECTLPAARSKK